MLENVNPPTNVVATLNTAQTAVNIAWGFPKGNYELLYDDGTQENWTIWADPNNMNAVKFTPVGFPCTLNGGKINIGMMSNYPSGGSGLKLFKIAIYDATGAGGTPGTAIVPPFNYTPTAYGWNNFTLPTPLTITSGDFYIVMIQQGSPPNAAGLGIDETATQLRSYSKFGTTPWIPASGNFMMRALMYGSGGPVPRRQ